MATTATIMATTATILATTPTILAIPPWLATGTIIALAGRGEVTTRSQLVKRWAQSSSAPRASLPQAAAIQIATIELIGWE